MSRDTRLEAVPLFAGLPDEDLDRLTSGVEELRLEPGTEVFREGDEGDSAYVIVDGEIEIVKRALNREMLLAVQGPGTVIGEMALLHDAPRMATGRARDRATLLRIPRATFDYILDTSPAASRRTMDIVLERFRANQAQLQQSERMAQLGTLTAGLAHELNNPAAAVGRGASDLLDAVDTHRTAYADADAVIDDRTELDALVADAMTRAARPPALDAVTRSDLETQLEDWLADRAVAEPWNVAPGLVELGYTVDELAEIERHHGGAAPAALAAVYTAGSLASIVHGILEGANRMSAIVRALKSYTYLDQAPVQDVDVRRGLDDTLLIMKRKLDGITVHREYAVDLPVIEAYGSELNQVWTNLIDNAADAIAGAGIEDGEVAIRAFAVDGGIAVEVEDNGPGIPEEHRTRVFDSFFTTKPPGSGTGLGLDISRSIVMTRHGGSIGVTSEPGRTVFRVELPLRPPA